MPQRPPPLALKHSTELLTHVNDTEPRRKIRVMIVEDSATARQSLQNIIGGDPRLEVVAAVDSAEKALRLLEPLSPDVISMDIHLPGMNGLEATHEIMRRKPTPIVVVSGTLASGELKKSMQALRAGALAVVEKPLGTRHRDFEMVGERLCAQLAIMSQVNVIRQRFNHPHRANAQLGPNTQSADSMIRRRDSDRPFSVLGLVASTGGPRALQTLIPSLGPDFPLPIVLVQHIMPSFHQGFVNWLNDTCPLPVCTATGFQPLEPGRIYVAPAEGHLEVHGQSLSISLREAVGGQRPSGTVLFESMARSLGDQALAVLLTGMGEDGAAGLKKIHDAGGYTIAEDESTAVVYGMPAVAVRARAVCQSLPLFDIGSRLRELVDAAPVGQPLSTLAEKTV